MEKEELIEKLTGELEPVRRLAKPAHRLLAWGIAATLLVLALTLLMGSFRTGFLNQLMSGPRFLTETLLGAALMALAAYSALLLCVPGESRSKLENLLVPFLLCSWMGLFLYGWYFPEFEINTIGHRPLCVVEVFVYAIPVFAALLYLAQRAVPLQPGKTGALMGLAACALPATVMQLACVYSPGHALTFHVLPVLLCTLLGTLIGLRYLRRI